MPSAHIRYARERDIPDIHIQTFPMFTPTGDYPNVTLPDLKIPFLNRLTHVISSKITWWGSRLGFEQVRRRAGLPKRKLYWPFDKDPARPPTPVLCAWSPSLLPPSSDWPPDVHVTGWYFLELNRQYFPPSEIKLFLDAGEPPVCVSFGSMVNRDAEKVDRIVREVAGENRKSWDYFVRMESGKTSILGEYSLPGCSSTRLAVAALQDDRPSRRGRDHVCRFAGRHSQYCRSLHSRPAILGTESPLDWCRTPSHSCEKTND